MAGEELSRTMDTAGSLEWRVFFGLSIYPYQPQIVAENYFIVSKGWMRRELERY